MSSTTYRICSKCGAHLVRRENVMTTSEPALYIYDCPECGNVEYDIHMYPCGDDACAIGYSKTVDYKAKYEEALEKARVIYKGRKAMHYTDEVSDLEFLFPELAETYDEMMIEAIIDALNSHCNSINHLSARGYQMEDVEAWLEKRKISTEGDFGRGYDSGYQAGYAVAMNEMKPKVATATLDSVKQKEQKPSEPSIDKLQRREEEFYNFKVFAAKQAKEHHISFVHDFEWNNFCAELLSYFNEKQKPESASASIMIPSCWEEKQKENPRNAISIPADCASNAKCPYKINGDEDFIGDIKGTPAYHFGFDEGVRSEREKQKPVDYDHEMWKNCEANFEGGKKEVIDHPEKYGLHKEQKPEWSEEDEQNFEWFDKLFRAESVVAGGRDIPQDKYLWFKSLRPQPKWKPSEAQMNNLNFGINALEKDGWVETARAIKDFYSDLKKLMED